MHKHDDAPLSQSDQEDDYPDGSDDGADDEAVERCAVVLLFSCVFVGGHRGALTSDE